MKWDVEFEPFQWEFLTSQARFPAFVAGWGTGKTMCGIAKGMALTEKYPNNLGLVVRKSFRDLSDSTMNDFTRYTGKRIPSNKDVEFDNGSKIMFRHLDELAGITQNVNLGWFYIEQAEEFESDAEFELLGGRLRREGCFCQGFIVANTNGHNWIWRKWKNAGGNEYMCDIPFDPDTNLEDRYSGYASLIEATMFDNEANLPQATIEAWKIKEKTAPASYRRFCLNSWEDTDTTDRVIPYEFIRKAVGRDLRPYDGDLTIISCDPAEFGDDKSVIITVKGLKVIDLKVTEKKELMETAGNVISKFNEHKADLIVIDDIGVGAGVRSRLREVLGKDKSNRIVPINTARRPSDPVRFNRLRDQIWMHAADLFREGYVSIPNDDTLIEDLAAFTYQENSKGQMNVARKKDIKKLLGRSPDYADALVMALWVSKRGRKPVLIPSYEREEDYCVLTYGL